MRTSMWEWKCVACPPKPEIKTTHSLRPACAISHARNIQHLGRSGQVRVLCSSTSCGRRTVHPSSVERRLSSAAQHGTSRITRLKQGESIDMELLSRLPVRGLCKGGNLKLSGPGAKADLTQESAKVAPLAAGRYGRKIQSDNDRSPSEPRQA